MATRKGFNYYTKEEIDEDILGYSTEEKAAGKWIDGSIIYKKTIEYNSGITTGVTHISHGIDNFGIAIKAEVIGVASNATLLIPALARDSAGSGNSVTPWVATATEVRIYSTMNYADTIYITLYYTKTASA